MKKIILAVLILSAITNSIFAENNNISISTNYSIAATSFSLEYKINETSQISIPIGMNMLLPSPTTIPPSYAGVLIEKTVAPYNLETNKLQLKFGYGVLLVYQYDELYYEEISPFALMPVLSAQLEQYITKNHSTYWRTTPPLGAFFFKDGIKLNLFDASNIFDYIRNFEVNFLLTLSIGYRYTYG